MTRRLAAILYADVAGYSRLTGLDEGGTHRQLSAALNAAADEIKSHGGRVVHYAGDAVLAEFSSVVAALECAMRVQQAVATSAEGIQEDREVDDVFELQGEITAIIAANLGEALWQSEAKRISNRSELDFDVYELCIRATQLLHRMDRDSIMRSIAVAERAYALGPDELLPGVILGFCHVLMLLHGYTDDPPATVQTTVRLAREALAKDEANPTVQRLAAITFLNVGQTHKAQSHIGRALGLNPYDADVLVAQAVPFRLAGNYDAAVEWHEIGIRYNRHAPPYYRASLGLCG
ncbi:MAG: hypothetical protein HOI95_07545 [Chromatiales bacterium]|nr:hypothetical protein [Chromatiales bacterium]